MTSRETYRIALAAGGTGGHVYPALAVVKALLERTPPPELFFFGRKSGLERELLQPLNLQYVGLTIQGWPRKMSLKMLSSPWLALGAFLKSLWTLLSRRPTLVVGFGSYVAAPVVLAALLLRIPTVVHEQNVQPGLANRLLAPWATRVLVSVPETAAALRRPDAAVVGIPLRREVIAAPRQPELLGLATDRRTVLIFGGSQGARRICQTVTETLRLLEDKLQTWQVLLITGRGNYAWVKSQPLPAGVVVRDYVETMGSAYAAADLVVARAGAVSLAEITAHGLPSILIPLPTATGGHQLQNARRLETHGAAVVIEDTQLTPDVLARTIRRLMDDPAGLAKMTHAARTLGRPDATELFVRQIEAWLKKC